MIVTQSIRQPEILDNIKDLGFRYSTVAGMTVALSDINVAPNKEKYVEEGKEQAAKLMKQYKRGRLTGSRVGR